ncbi:MAG: DUF4286 family protein [Flavobacteriales bacterium]
MIIYNVTVKIDSDVHDEWLNWMREVHIPDVLSTGHFKGNQIAKVLVDDEDGITYSIQYRCDTMDDLQAYYRDHAPRLQEEHTSRYRDKFVAFRTLLELMD